VATLSERRHHEELDRHVRGRWLSDLILGAQDGLVNTLGVVLGVAGASGNARVTLATGLAAGLAEAASMAAVAYTSSAARGNLFRAERAREYRHIAAVPGIEREEIRRFYVEKGFDGDLLEQVVDKICANKDVWVNVMMSEEHHLASIDARACGRSAGVVGTAALVGSAVPVLPFVATGGLLAVGLAVLLGAVGLFILGALAASITTGSRSRSGVELALIGLGSAAIGWAVGSALGVQ
jgi:VIT1/CCC1 family predicted Fe2+/Mn2+ transporter